MGSLFSLHRILVLATSAFAVAILIGITFYESASRTRILTASFVQPMIGAAEAPIEMVVFEDFRCGGCRAFHEKIFPQIRSQYIDTGFVRCRFIPLGFLKGSKSLANAALAVYALSPDRFSAYASALFEQFERMSIESDQVASALIDLAIKVGGIDMQRLKESIQKGLYYHEVDQNLGIAKTVMGKQFRLPAVYINGIAGSTQNVKALQKLIEAAMQ